MIHYYTDMTISAGVLIEQSIQQLVASIGQTPKTQTLVIQFSHSQYYLPDQSPLELLALLIISESLDEPVTIEGSVFPFTPKRLEQLQALPDSLGDGGNTLKEYCHSQSLPWLVMSDPWVLAPVHIPKPWGQEIWYTGIEARGQAGVAADTGSIPLPWLLELMSIRIGLPEKSQPILLKVLDPLADEIYGDLYFELHQEKQEVYVVTHIDQKAWPNGNGAIQLGFAAQARARYETDDEFKQAYLDAVKKYEQVRRLVDHQLDGKKIAAGIAIKQPVDGSQLMKWISELLQQTENTELFNKERELRLAMNSFVACHPLRLGDVVTVPKLVPHALQHGVRVVEFQTPVYERKILSFGQKVLTQSHWDTEDALALVNLDFAQLQPPEQLSVNHQWQVERIVNFDDFEVQRILLDGEYMFSSGSYSLLMVVQGSLNLRAAGKTNCFEAGQAFLMPKLENSWLISSEELCVFLLASPH